MELLYNLNLYNLLKIILIDLVLAGDNAVVIAMAARNLDVAIRNKVILIGTLGAIIIRIALTSMAILLLSIKGLMLAGGLLLLYISYKLLFKKEDKAINAKNKFLDAVITIVVADVIMSIDNVMAVAGVAEGDFLLVIFGIFISIFLVIFASKMLIVLLDKYPFINYVGAFLITYTGINMVLHDGLIINLIDLNNYLSNTIIKIFVIMLSIIFILLMGTIKLYKKK